MKNRKVIYVVYPETLKTVSMNELAMCELLLNELALSQNKKIKFQVKSRMRLIECNDSKVKKILDLFMKAGKLPDIKAQFFDLLHKNSCIGDVIGKLILLIDDRQIGFTVREVESGEDFSWEVTRSF